MLTKIKFGFLVVFAVAMMASCASGEGEADDAARQSVAPTTAATPAAPGTPATNAAAAPAAPAGPTTSVSFAESTFDFGKVDAGEKVTHTYSFENTGSEPLIISNAKGSCGCTVPDWPKEPIPVGGSGEITVVFDSKNKKGPKNQKVTITANTDPPQTFIYMKGEVIPAEGAANNVQVQQ